MITTVNLNPCIDKMVKIQHFTYGGLNRIIDSRSDVAGKGLNVAVAFTQLGGKAVCTGINYEEKGKLVEEFLNDIGVMHDFVVVPGEVRTNLKIFDESQNVVTEVNESGYPVSEEFFPLLKAKLDTYARQSSIVVLGGSVPKGVSITIYRELLDLISDLPVKTILDAEGELLVEGLKGKPNVIKPNLYELETALNARFTSHKEIVWGARNLIREGVEIVGVSLGKEGAIILDEEKAYYTPGLEVDVKGTAGAGDSIVAGFCLAMEEGKDMKEMLRYGVAAATASVMREGTLLCTKEGFDQILDKVQIVELNL